MFLFREIHRISTIYTLFEAYLTHKMTIYHLIRILRALSESEVIII